MKLSSVIASTLVGVFAVSPAFAQEATFTGATVTALVGYDSVNLSVDDFDDSANESGVAYGVALGYDFDLGGVTLGLEGEIADSSTEYSENGILEAGDEARISADRDLYVGARIGFRVAQNALLYAKGGYTNAKFKVSYEDSEGAFGVSEELDGYRIGVGAEMKFGKVFGRLEYRYSDYGNLTFLDVDTDASVSRHQVLAGVGVRF